MKIIRTALMPLFVICLTLSLFAQIPGKSTNSNSNLSGTKAAEELLVDVKKLPLPQDRAYVLGYVGEYFCKNGEKDRAEKIFEESIREIILAQNKAKKTDGNFYENLIYGNNPRPQIIRSISNCDSEMAYKFLLQSRSSKLSQILEDLYKKQIYPEPKTIADKAITNEIGTESSIQSQITRNNPKRLAEFINQDIEKALSYFTIQSIKELSKKDSTLANELTEKVVNKILRLKFYDYEKKELSKTGYFYHLSIALSFLRELENDRPRGNPLIRVSEGTLIRLADKISDETINSGLNWLSSDSMKTIKRFFPDRIPQLEKIKNDQQNSPENLERRKYQQMFKNNLPDTEILSSSENFSESNQKHIFSLIACRQVKEGKFDQAKSFFNEKFGKTDNSESLLNYVFYSNALQSYVEKDFENALALAKRIPDPIKSLDAQTFLVELFYAKNTKQNKAKSLILLSELTQQFDSDSRIENKEFGLGKIVRIYALIEPEVAFPMFEFLIYKTNKTDDSDSLFDSTENATSSSFHLKSGVKFEYLNTIYNLGKTEIDRTLLIINKLKSPFSRVNLKLGILKNKSSSFYNEEILHFCDLRSSFRSTIFR